MLSGAEFRSRSGRARGLDDDDLEQQVAFIEGSMYAHLHETTASRPVTSTEEDDSTVGPPSDKAFVASALKVAEAIRSRAIRAEDGSAAWIAPQYLVQAERYQLQPMDYNLYGGTCGVALFLAAAERFAPGSGYGELALAAVRPLQSVLDRRGPPRRYDGYRRRLGPRLGRVLPAPRQPPPGRAGFARGGAPDRPAHL